MNIKYELESNVVSPLKPGELGYSYSSRSLFIGPPNSDSGGQNVIEVLKFQNNVLNYIIQEIRIDLIDRVPSSHAVFQALQKKASLLDSNVFKSANYFPDVDIDNTPPSQQQLVVNVRSLKEYVRGKMAEIAKAANLIKDLSSGAGGLDGPIEVSINTSAIKRYTFNVPLYLWTIPHAFFKTRNVKLSIYNSSGVQMMAPYETPDDITIKIYFSQATSGYVDVQFF